jgi:hypothetical protein
MVTKSNFETKIFEFDVTTNEKRKDLGVITLYSALNGADQGLAIVEDSGESDSGGAQQTATVDCFSLHRMSSTELPVLI